MSIADLINIHLKNRLTQTGHFVDILTSERTPKVDVRMVELDRQDNRLPVIGMPVGALVVDSKLYDIVKAGESTDFTDVTIATLQSRIKSLEEENKALRDTLILVDRELKKCYKILDKT